MVVIGLKIGEGLKLVGVDVVGLKILDHWFEFSFGSLGFKSRIVVILCLDCWVVVEDGLMVCVCICVCFLADFWVCVFFFVFG